MGLILLPPLCWLAVFDDGRPAARGSLPAAPRRRAISGDGAAPARRRRPPADRDFDFTCFQRAAPRAAVPCPTPAAMLTRKPVRNRGAISSNRRLHTDIAWAQRGAVHR